MVFIQKCIRVCLIIIVISALHAPAEITAESLPNGNYWVKNIGQAGREIRYYSLIKDGRILITENGIIFQFIDYLNKDPLKINVSPDKLMPERYVTFTENVFLSFYGADLSFILEEDQASARLNYFTGGDEGSWHRDIPVYQKLRVVDIYPGIDLVFDGNSTRYYFEFDGVNARV